MTLRPLALTLGLVAVATATSAASPSSPGDSARPPHILEFQYSEDYESNGRRHDAAAIVKGEARRVRARSGPVLAEGRLSRHISPTGPGKLWFFRDRDFVRHLRADLGADGVATVAVRAANDGGRIRKRCKLLLEPDPVYGDFATGDCARR